LGLLNWTIGSPWITSPSTYKCQVDKSSKFNYIIIIFFESLYFRGFLEHSFSHLEQYLPDKPLVTSNTYVNYVWNQMSFVLWYFSIWPNSILRLSFTSRIFNQIFVFFEKWSSNLEDTIRRTHYFWGKNATQLIFVAFF